MMRHWHRSIMRSENEPPVTWECNGQHCYGPYADTLPFNPHHIVPLSEARHARPLSIPEWANR